jgi:low affinity Fe/Cu permease
MVWKLLRFCETFAKKTTKWAGSSLAFLIAILIVLIWIVTGPLFKFSDTWQLVINTGTTIVTFLMVFLIQRTQNKDSIALQLKLNELLAAHQGASNRLLNIEELSEEEILAMQKKYRKLADRIKCDENPNRAFTVDEVDDD